MTSSLEKPVKDLIKNMKMINVWIVDPCNIEKLKGIYSKETPPKPHDVVIIYRGEQS